MQIGNAYVNFTATGLKEISAAWDTIVKKAKTGNIEAAKAFAGYGGQSKAVEAALRKKAKGGDVGAASSLIEMVGNRQQQSVTPFKQMLSIFQQATPAILQMGMVAQGAFNQMQGGIMSVVKMASPLDFERLQVGFAAVSIQVGRIFLPLIRELTTWLYSVATWFQNLTDEQRDNIVQWTKLTLYVLGFVIVLGRVWAIGTTVVLIAKGLGAALMALGSAVIFVANALRAMAVAMISNPVTAIFVLIGAIAGLATGLNALSNPSKAAIADMDRLAQSAGDVSRQIQGLNASGGAVGQRLISAGLSGVQRADLARAQRRGEERPYIEGQIATLQRETRGQTRDSAETMRAEVTERLQAPGTNAPNVNLENRRRMLAQAGFTPAQIADANRGGALREQNMTPEAINRIASIPVTQVNQLEIFQARLRDIIAGRPVTPDGAQSNHVGNVRMPAAQLGSLAEAWKKIQTAQQDDPQTQILALQLRQLNVIATNTTPPGGAQPPPTIAPH